MPAISEGSDIGPYRVLHPLPELHEDGLVEAWLSELPDRQEQIQIVLNILRMPHYDPDEEHRRAHTAFRNEVDILTRSRHLNIARIYPLPPKALSVKGESYLSQVNLDDESWWFWAMEHLEGRSLASRMRQVGRLPLDEAAEVAYQIATALDYLHSKDIVHLNVQPQSIFFRYPLSGPSPRVELVLTGFGDAAEADQAMVGGEGAEMAYMAPERIRSRAGVDQPVDNRPLDVYSLGVLIYHMLAGVLPFTGSDEDVERAIRASRPNPLPRFDVPAEVEDLIFQTMHKDPAKRPSMETLMITLDKSVPPPREVGAGVQVTIPERAPAEGEPGGAEEAAQPAPSLLGRLRGMFAGAPSVPELLVPADGETLQGRVIFAWDWEGGLKDDQAFELRMWKEGQSHDRAGELQREPELEIDLDTIVPELPGEEDECSWSVAVVEESPYRSISEEAEPRSFVYGEPPPEEEGETPAVDERSPEEREPEDTAAVQGDDEG